MRMTASVPQMNTPQLKDPVKRQAMTAPRQKGITPTEWKGMRAIMSHAEHTGVPRQTSLEKALYACDEITGLITAVALVRPSRSLFDLEASSVRKKWKDKAFAAGANREEIARGAEEFGVPLWEHCGNVIEALRKIAPQIGLVGNVTEKALGLSTT